MESAKRNKNIIAIEQSLFQQVINKEKHLLFSMTPQGFHYAHLKKSSQINPLPKKRGSCYIQISDRRLEWKLTL